LPAQEPTGDNPFFHRGPVRNPAFFFGRQAELAQVLGLVQNAQSVSVVGPRRIGKTSLLLQLARRLQEAHTPVVYLTCEGHERSTPDQLYSHLAEELAAVGGPASGTAGGEPYRRLERVLRAQAASGQAVVLLMDEFEILGTNPELDPHFFSALRGLASRFPLAYVTASQAPLIALTYSHPDILSSPFFNCFATVPLRLFSADEALELVRTLAGRSGLQWGSDVLEEVCLWAGPQPLFLQLAGYHACEAQRAGMRGEDLPVEMRARSWADLLPHLQYAWQIFSDRERYALATLPLGADKPLLERLESQCVIRRADPQAELHPAVPAYDYASAAWRRFIGEQQVPQVFQDGALLVDGPRQAVLLRDTPVHLTHTQFQVLSHLMARGGRLVTTQELEQAVWHDNYVDDPERVKTVIKLLRRALGDAGNRIVNRRGQGYLFVAGGANPGHGSDE
jgi:hypothetical protein